MNKAHFRQLKNTLPPRAGVTGIKVRRPLDRLDPLAAFLMALLLITGLIVTSHAQACPPLLDFRYPSLQTGEPQNLCKYKGKVVLVVNTASYCAYTDQYAGLEALYRQYKDQGLVVLGFPSNDFGMQEPGSNKDIAKFCRLTYGVEFPMFAKAGVKGDARLELFAELARRTGDTPRWNFHKYLIDRSGARVMSFESAIKPDDKRLLDALKNMLEARPIPVRST
jgi:glutathione peroxidase